MGSNFLSKSSSIAFKSFLSIDILAAKLVDRDKKYIQKDKTVVQDDRILILHERTFQVFIHCF